MSFDVGFEGLQGGTERRAGGGDDDGAEGLAGVAGFHASGDGARAVKNAAGRRPRFQAAAKAREALARL